MLPRGANGADRRQRRVGVGLVRVGGEEVRGDLLLVIAEQRGLGREELERDGGARGQADVVLRADAMTQQERHVPRVDRDLDRHGRHDDLVGPGRLR